ncbi:3-hydroxyacyl-CoA dehydrogenase NAD-binding domain-containing protein [Massilia niastensis]|uniref:3-hydroxyacyl-CoA dehydrogenase NAD-binding domain-containing protein n=1 Tax=Massilia niastensis TaxID=544911 RepID=UPI00036BC11E|nr:3-hydroxyacyl-CoA dehydrogenase NAD-binding domain-containing protein [Massilia niastensis]
MNAAVAGVIATNGVRIERDGDVAVVIIDNPPVNAASAHVRRGLVEALGTLRQDIGLCGAVIMGAGSSFIAGSDLREFGQALQDPQLPEVIAAIEGCGKPVVAALHGAAFGGGFELALGCDARLAAPRTLVGLPEVTLGIIPGAGGTQRLPRLVGVARAIRMVCSGERVPAVQALELGVLDGVVEEDLRAAACAHARMLAAQGARRRVRDLPLPVGDAAAIEAATRAALRAGRNQPAVRAAIDAIGLAASTPIDAALAEERRMFQELRIAPDAHALRYQFFAERDAARQPALAGVTARPIRRIAVLGAGTMGSGIAISALDGGFEVLLLDQDPDALARGRQRVLDHYSSRAHASRLEPGQMAQRVDRFAATTAWERLVEADMVIEAVFEDLAVKQEVFRKIDAIARPGALLASNTSYLDLDAIAGATWRPQDVVGLHFFSPAHVMRLLEVVQGRATAPDALATGLETARRLGKLPVVAGNAFGFIGNRIYAAYRRQCEFMLEEGAYPEQVDSALEAFGFAMGPFAVADMSGLDIAWRMRRSQAASRDPGARYVDIPDRLCELGRFGRKTGAGYYAYADGKDKAADPLVAEVIDAASASKGIVRRRLDSTEIQRRALLAMANEAALLLADGVAQRPGDIDVVLVNGFGFPRWEGGPVYWARQRGRDLLATDMDFLAALGGPGFDRGRIELLDKG